jgi:peptidoglycan/xylan/chitin deacetylase (PgdA/CDA1 family)
LESTGRVRVVSQTHTHPPDLRTLSDAALRREMWEAKIRMEEELGRGARFVTYPSGKWDGRVALAAAEAGYKLGMTEDRGLAEDSPHLQALNRFSTPSTLEGGADRHHALGERRVMAAAP